MRRAKKKVGRAGKSKPKRKLRSKWSVYILECIDRSLYVGISNDVERRLNTHNLGRGAKYTRARLPVKLLYQESVGPQGDAMKRELQLKRWPRVKKLALALS